MRSIQPGQSEHAVASYFEYLCAIRGSQRPAYVPVIASGYDKCHTSENTGSFLYSSNALIIHYTSNNQIIREGEMILMDAGCEYK